MLARAWFDGAHSGPIQQWDFKLLFSGWLRNALAVVPSVNLVTNLGFGEGATHEQQRDANHPFAGVPAHSIDFPLRHPPRVEVLDDADRATWDVMVARFMRARRGRFRRRLGDHLAGGSQSLRAFFKARRTALREIGR